MTDFFKSFFHGMRNSLYVIRNTTCVLLAFASFAHANNLVISNVSLETRNASANTVVVEFDISWDHSWRMSNGEHDAAWVFVKLLDGNTGTPTYPWLHGKLYTAGTNPNDGTSPGTNTNLEVVVPSDKIGAFIRRKVTGNGTVSSQNVRLVVDYGTAGASDSDQITAKVYGIEMVYVPEGPFYIGDGNGSSETPRALHENGVDNTAVMITTTAKSITADTNANDDIDTSPVNVDGDGGITGNTSWPVGYNDFYLMKYELTQQQYRDFLNTLSRTQQSTRVAATVTGDTVTNYYVMSDSTTVDSRQGIRAPASGNGTANPITFGNDFNDNGTFNEVDDGLTIAMNYVSWMDLAAYADWAGLRPYTELEFEKAARGPETFVLRELAWGSTGWATPAHLTAVSGITNSGRSDEVSSNTGPGLSVYASSISGPMRVGFAAGSATNRIAAGAGYYGHMELSGNMYDAVVALGQSVGRSFTGTHGDGVLTTTTSYEGNATNNDWPGINATTARGVTAGTGAMARGGGWTSTEQNLRIADRNSNAPMGTTRSSVTGGRFARTAP